MGEVYNRVVNALREHTGEGDKTRGSDGEYNDYLEKRRPFVEADNLKHSHWFMLYIMDFILFINLLILIFYIWIQ